MRLVTNPAYRLVMALAIVAVTFSVCLGAEKPQVNGPSVFGVRAGSPMLYTIPVTGDRPMQFRVDNLPEGLSVDAANGQITGKIEKAGEYAVVLNAKNDAGEATKNFRIIVGDKICLTPPLGWNSWNCWAAAVDQEKVLHSAKAMVKSGLIHHGWTYINIDDTWQGTRGGKFHGIQPNEKFPDMKKLCDEIHAMGLKTGIYSTPWITSYAGYCGGSSDAKDGAWDKKTMGFGINFQPFYRHGKYPFAENDAKQWADWGFDYLKYDWNPNDVPHVTEMSEALRKSGRDVVYSLSNTAPFEHAADWARLANCWRTTGDIRDAWGMIDEVGCCSISQIGFSQDKWAPFAGSGHWNDPDMLVLGYVGWGPALHKTKLTLDEQRTHFGLWCMLSAPLLIGCDMDRLDAETLELLANDEVLALDQDALGKQARRQWTIGAVDIYVKDLEDGNQAVGLFNRSKEPETLRLDLFQCNVDGNRNIRDLWQHKDVAKDVAAYTTTVPGHGCVLLKLTPAK
jgi:alpha-galactosidase